MGAIEQKSHKDVFLASGSDGRGRGDGGSRTVVIGARSGHDHPNARLDDRREIHAEIQADRRARGRCGLTVQSQFDHVVGLEHLSHGSSTAGAVGKVIGGGLRVGVGQREITDGQADAVQAQFPALRPVVAFVHPRSASKEHRSGGRAGPGDTRELRARALGFRGVHDNRARRSKAGILTTSDLHP